MLNACDLVGLIGIFVDDVYEKKMPDEVDVVTIFSTHVQKLGLGYLLLN